MKGGIAMKKYEKPMVELTKFNATDIIATNGEPGKITINTAEDKSDAVKTAVKTAGGFDAVGTFNW